MKVSDAWLQLRKSPVKFFFGFAAISWGLAFLKYIDQPYVITGSCASACNWQAHFVFPFFPNILDVLGLILLGAYLLYEVVRRAAS